jgi:hypothetical protein
MATKSKALPCTEASCGDLQAAMIGKPLLIGNLSQHLINVLPTIMQCNERPHGCIVVATVQANVLLQAAIVGQSTDFRPLIEPSGCKPLFNIAGIE